jgi:AAA+ superfamily predicted ATPase
MMTESTTCCTDDKHQLLDELRRLDSLLRRGVQRARAQGNESDPFKGLYISDKDADLLLEECTLQNQDLLSSSSRADDVYAAKASVGQRGRAEESLPSRNEPRLRKLARTFSLSNIELNAVVICLAVELDKKYGKLYAYLQDDLTRKRPTLGFIIDLLCPNPEEKIAIRHLFLPEALLFKHGIIELAEERDGSSNLASALRLNSDVLAYILGDSDDAEDLAEPNGSSGINGLLALSSRLPSSIRPKLENLALRLAENSRGTICSLQGSYGRGRREAAEIICRSLGVGIITLVLTGLPAEERGLKAAVSRAFRLALMKEAAVYVQDFDSLAPDDPRAAPLKGALVRALDEFQGLTFIECREAIDLGRRLQKRLLTMKIPKPDFTERLRAWRGHLPGWPEEEIDDLAVKFKLTTGQIEDAVSSAWSLAALDGRGSLCREDLYEGCRMQSNRRLSRLARRIEPRYRLEDVILPQDCMEQLREIKAYVRHQGIVYGDWGFGKKLSLGKGLNIQFTGDSGTGKTMAAEALAFDLGLELYKVDLSTVVSKYIGETEKNLSRIFAEAEESNAILFFDEADAIFGKRSEVKDAHDRYANVETGYLLQKMEEHEGIVVLATNLDRNLDEAFKRRMHFVVKFPFPSEESRLQIWKSLLPVEASVAGDLDFQFLARGFQIAGGNIKNVLVTAAFLAAEDSGVITMKHLVRATSREMKKIGRVCGESEFRQYHDLAKGK